MNPLTVLWQILASGTGFHELVADGERTFCPVESRWTFERTIPSCARAGMTISLSAAPRSKPDSMTVAPASVVWARLESGKGADALQRFSPAPTLVLREGKTVKRTAFWALRRPLAYDWALRANKRVAHALGAAKKHADPSFMFTPPGCEADGKIVWVEFADEAGTLFMPNQVVAHLRDAPAPRDWRAAA